MAALDGCWDWQPATPSVIQRPAALLRLQGADALRFLHGQSSQAIEAAAAGDCRPTCLIGPTARMRALAQVLVDGDGAWLLIEAGDAEAVRSALDRVLFPADRVELGTLRSVQLLTPVAGGEPLAVPQLGPPCPDGRWQALPGHSDIWQLGADLVLGNGQAPAALGALPLLDGALQERWRIQRGWPTSSGECNDATNPFELGLANRVSLQKGCYVGQETLAKLATYDGVKQQLRRWCWSQPADQAAGPPPEQALRSGQTLHGPDAERAGVITTALSLEQADGSTLWLGLALVRRSALAQPSLRAGDSDAGPWLALSKPTDFVDPPVGSGQR